MPHTSYPGMDDHNNYNWLHIISPSVPPADHGILSADYGTPPTNYGILPVDHRTPVPPLFPEWSKMLSLPTLLTTGQEKEKVASNLRGLWWTWLWWIWGWNQHCSQKRTPVRCHQCPPRQRSVRTYHLTLGKRLLWPHHLTLSKRLVQPQRSLPMLSRRVPQGLPGVPLQAVKVAIPMMTAPRMRNTDAATYNGWVSTLTARECWTRWWRCLQTTREKSRTIFQHVANEDPEFFIEDQAQSIAAVYTMHEVIVSFNTQFGNMSCFAKRFRKIEGRHGRWQEKASAQGVRVFMVFLLVYGFLLGLHLCLSIGFMLFLCSFLWVWVTLMFIQVWVYDILIFFCVWV